MLCSEHAAECMPGRCQLQSCCDFLSHTVILVLGHRDKEDTSTFKSLSSGRWPGWSKSATQNINSWHGSMWESQHLNGSSASGSQAEAAIWAGLNLWLVETISSIGWLSRLEATESEKTKNLPTIHWSSSEDRTRRQKQRNLELRARHRDLTAWVQILAQPRSWSMTLVKLLNLYFCISASSSTMWGKQQWPHHGITRIKWANLFIKGLQLHALCSK